MKVAISAQPGMGHTTGLALLALRFKELGHQVLCVGSKSVSVYFAGLGLEARALCEDPLGSDSPLLKSLVPELSSEDPMVALIELRRNVSVGMRADALIPGMISELATFKPDLLIRDATEVASWLVSSFLGIPQLPFEVSSHWTEEMWLQHCGSALEKLQRTHNIARTSLKGDWGMYAFGHISNSPDFLRMKEPPLPVGTIDVIPNFQERERSLHSDWIADHEEHLFMTFGSVYAGRIGYSNFQYPGMGPNIPVALSNATVAISTPLVLAQDYLAQSDFMSKALATVCHAGRSTVLTSLKNAIPVVCMPVASDHFDIAAAVRETELGVTVSDLDSLSIGDLVELIGKVASNEQCLGTMKQIQSMPTVDSAVDQIMERVESF